MEALPEEEIGRIHPLLLEDERKRDRAQFAYAYDVLAENCITQFSIWPMPNADVTHIINGEIDLDDLLFEDQNEFEKGLFFEELQEFIAQHTTKGQMLCEAMDYGPCLQERCPLFRDRDTPGGGEHGICVEYKIAFRK